MAQMKANRIDVATIVSLKQDLKDEDQISKLPADDIIRFYLYSN